MARQLLVGILAVAAFLALAVAAPFAARPEAEGHFGWLSLAPAAVAIGLAFATRQVIVALLAGVVAGGVVFAFGSAGPDTTFATFPWDRLNFLQAFVLPGIGSLSYAIILVVYLWSLGGLIGLWTRTGGAQHFATVMGRRFVRGPRSARVFTWLLGMVFHQGGTISTILAGTTARPLLDQHRISKEESTYLVDSTSSPVATIIPFNVFPIFVAGVVAGSVPAFTTAAGAPDVDAAVAFFFEALPWNFYAFAAVTLTLLVAAGWFPTVGGLRRARRRVDEGGPLVRPGSAPLSSDELSDVDVARGYRTSLNDFLMPLAFLLTIAIGPFLIQRAVGGTGQVYVVEAFVAALAAGVAVALVKGMAGQTVLDGVLDGAKGVTPAAIILGLALTLKGVAEALGTGTFAASALSGLSAAWLPGLLMLTAMAVAFSTGTSFGTFAVLFPVALPLAHVLLPGDLTFLAACFGAVLSGSVFGDQCSPMSDTTVLSSLALGCDLMDHVTTQIPMAAIAAGVALAGFFGAGLLLF